MADEKDKDPKAKEEIETLKAERANAKAEAEASKQAAKDGEPASKPTRKRKTTGRRSKAQIAEEMFPMETWGQVTDFVLDGATSAAGTTTRSKEEKQAFASTGRNVAIKHLPSAKYAEEIMFGCVVVPIALSILVEALGNLKDKRAAQYEREQAKQASLNTREIGVRENASSETGY